MYDGSNDQTTQIVRPSVDSVGGFDISSTGNSIIVTFESDEYSGGGTGFLATIHYGTPYMYIK